MPSPELGGAGMRRREFFTLISGAAALPLAVRAQQSAFPGIGFLHLTSLEETRDFLAAFHRGLGETGYVENKNVTIEYRWGQGHNDRLPTLIEELARRQVSVIVMLGSTHGALAAKAATRTIPIVFMVGADPVQIGLIDSLSKPGGNLTGINLFNVEVAAKRLELLLQMVPAAKSVAYLRTGVFTGHILKGEKPATMPVQQATKVDLFINLKTAKSLGLTVPLPLLGRADKVIE